jgi:hypothetical protein
MADRRSLGYQGWECASWPVSWSAIWVGALAALAVALIIGLIGIAVGAYQVGPDARIVSWRKVQMLTLIFGICGAFFSFVVGGWTAGKILGSPRGEASVLHGAIVWLLTVPLLLLLASLGAANYFGAWYGGLAGTPAWVTPTTAVVDPEAARIAKNAALGAIVALLVGLVGGVIGGWLASGEPMTLTFHRTRAALATSGAKS